MSELLYGLLISGGTGVLVIAARLYIETHWIGLPRRRWRQR